MLVGYPTRKEWIKSYDAERTRNSLSSALKQFDVLLEELKLNEKKFMDQARQIPENELFLVIDKLKNTLEKKYSYKTARSYHGFILMWMRVNGIGIDPNNLKLRIRWNHPHIEMKYTPDRETIQKMIDNSSLIYKVFYHVAVSTGARQSEILSLTWGDIELNKEIPTVHFLAKHTKTKVERYSFLTPEAKEMVQKLNVIRFDDGKIFEKITNQSLQKQVSRLRKRLGFNEHYETGTSKLSIHRLRAYTKRKLSRVCGDDFAHLILGHTGQGLGTYDGDTIEELSQDYSKAIPELTINIHAKDRVKHESQGEKIKLLEQKIELMEKYIPHNTHTQPQPANHMTPETLE